MGLLVIIIIIGAIVATMFSLKNDRKVGEAYRKGKEEQRKAAQIEEEAAAKKALEERMQEETKRKADWEANHGRIIVPIAGVTFDNEDGTSRQRLLKDLKVRGGDAHLELEEYEFKGKPAIRVMVDGDCIGNIPKTRVAEVSDVLDRIENAHLEIERFTPDDDDDDDRRKRPEIIYRADLYITYSKQAIDQRQE